MRKYDCVKYSKCLDTAARIMLDEIPCEKCRRYKQSSAIAETDASCANLWLRVIIHACQEYTGGVNDEAREFLLSEEGQAVCGAANVRHHIVARIVTPDRKTADSIDLSKTAMFENLREKGLRPLGRMKEPRTITGYGIRLRKAKALGYETLAEFLQWVCSDPSIPHQTITEALGYHHSETAMTTIIRCAASRAYRRTRIDTDRKNKESFQNARISGRRGGEVEQVCSTA